MKGDQPFMSYGFMGGGMQPQGHIQVLVNIADFGMNLQEAMQRVSYTMEDRALTKGWLPTTGPYSSSQVYQLKRSTLCVHGAIRSRLTIQQVNLAVIKP